MSITLEQAMAQLNADLLAKHQLDAQVNMLDQRITTMQNFIAGHQAGVEAAKPKDPPPAAGAP